MAKLIIKGNEKQLKNIATRARLIVKRHNLDLRLITDKEAAKQAAEQAEKEAAKKKAVKKSTSKTK